MPVAPAMLLTHLPQEVAHDILAYCSGRSLVLLYLSGDPRVHRQLLHVRGATSFTWKYTTSLAKIPQILTSLTSLRRIYLSGPYSLFLYGDTSPRIIFPPTLEVLELDFPKSYIYFFCSEFPAPDVTAYDRTDLNYDELYPRLHTLLIRSSKNSGLPPLPDSITQLTVYSADNGTHQGTPPITRIPKSLERAYIEVPFAEPGRNFEWPRNLHTLLLPMSTWRRLPENFPPTITKIEMAYPCTPFDRTRELQMAVNLKSAKLLGGAGTEAMVFLSELSLETLKLGRIVPNSISQWPSTLTFLECSSPLSSVYHLFELLPHGLKTLIIHSYTGELVVNAYKRLPDQLSTFIIEGPTILPDHFGSLPRSLTVCPMVSSAVLTGSDLVKLPTGLKSLHFPHRTKYMCLIDGSHLSRGPDSLTELHFDTDTTSLGDLDLRYLPRTLVHFTHLRKHGIEGSGLGFFPPTLRTLILPTCNSVGDKHIGKLPPLLTHLEFGGDNLMLTPKSFGLFPRTLNTLYISNMSSITDTKSFALLPCSLMDLSLPGLGAITDHLLRFVPNYLVRITLKLNKSLKPRALDFAKPSLQSLVLPKNSNFSHIKHPLFAPLESPSPPLEVDW